MTSTVGSVSVGSSGIGSCSSKNNNSSNSSSSSCFKTSDSGPSSSHWEHTDPLTALWKMSDFMPLNDVTIGPDHKTVIVLDHSPDFATSSNCKIDIPLKDPTTGQMRMTNQVEKTLWTCAVESAFEFHRIVDEIYPDGTRLMRFVISDFVGRFLIQNWGTQLISYDQLVKSFATCGVPDAKADLSSCSIINGISIAVEAISELTELQKKQWDLNSGFQGCRKYRHGEKISEVEKNKQLERIYADFSDEDCDGDSNDNTNDDDNVADDDNDEFGNAAADDNDDNGAVAAPDDDISGNNRKADLRHIRFKRRLQRLASKIKFAKEEMLTLTMKNGTKKSLPNTGSVVVFTSLKSDEDIAMLVKHITEDINSRNKIVKALDGDRNFAPITHVQVYFIIMYPVTDGNRDKIYLPTSKPLFKLNECVSYSVVCAEAGPSLRPILHGLILKHFDLASTTVISIPMKEEAQQGQSVNYDVEIFHPRRSHRLLQHYGLIAPGSKIRSICTPGNYETIKLSWTTPSAKNRWNQFPRCISALPISPASVNSRPSVCLTSFLLSGRNVMLEVLKQNVQLPQDVVPNVNQKLISHLLMCHAGRIYMHTIYIGNHPVLDDKKLLASAVLPKPSILFCVADFSILMKETRLARPSEAGASLLSDKQTYDAQERLKRLTQYWPIKLNEALFYSLPEKFDSLMTVMRQSELSTNDVNKCREWISEFMIKKNINESLTSKATVCDKFKNPPNREEKFRFTCEEILSYLHNYKNHSERHLEVYNMFAQISGLDCAISLTVHNVPTSSLESQISQSSVSAARNQSLQGAVHSESYNMSPVSKKSRKIMHFRGSNEKRSLYDVLLEQYQKDHWTNWKDFVGRVKAGNKAAVLYPNLDLNKTSVKGDADSS